MSITIRYQILKEISENQKDFFDLAIVKQENASLVPNVGEIVIVDKIMYKIVHKVISLDENWLPKSIDIVVEIL